MILAALTYLMIFCAVCTTDNGVIPPLENFLEGDATLDNIEFSCEAVRRAINRLKNNTTSGPDGMPPVMYRNPA
jgi:hypothetical protein